MQSSRLQTKFLGVVIDSHLKFDLHRQSVLRKCSLLYMYCLIVVSCSPSKYFIIFTTRWCILILTSAWQFGAADTYNANLKTLFTLQKRALRIISPQISCAHSEDLLKIPKILSVYDSVTFNVASLMYQINYGNVCSTTLLHPSVLSVQSDLRHRLLLPRINTTAVIPYSLLEAKYGMT